MPNSKHRNATKALITILSVTLVGIYGLSQFRPEPQKREPAKPSPIEIEAEQFWPQNYQVVIHSQGKVQAQHRIDLAAQVQGTIVARHEQFTLGGAFQKGDVLAQLDSANYHAAYQSAIAELKKAQHELSEAKAESKTAIQNWARLGNKGKPSDYVSKRSQVIAREAQLNAAEANLQKAKLDLDRTHIVAPFNGYVVGNPMDVGNFVSTGMTLGQIIASDKLIVALPISARWREFILNKHLIKATQQPRHNIKISLPNIEGASWKARVSGNLAEIDANTRQLTLIAEVDLDSASRDDIQLLAGDYVHAVINGSYLDSVFVLPRQALREGRYVWAVLDQKLYRKHVDVAWTDAHVAIIREGLQSGERVAINKLGQVVSGTEVAIKNMDSGLDQKQVNAFKTRPADSDREAVAL